MNQNMTFPKEWNTSPVDTKIRQKNCYHNGQDQQNERHTWETKDERQKYKPMRGQGKHQIDHVVDQKAEMKEAWHRGHTTL